MAKHILLYGKDPLLLEIRTLLLRHSGFAVANVPDLSAFSEQLTSSQINLLVFCHTLSISERHAASATIHALSPDAKIMRLISGYSVATDDLIHPLNISAGPQALVDRSRELTA